MKQVLSAVTLLFALASPAWAAERQYLCTSEHLVGFRGQGDGTYSSYYPFDRESKYGRYILTVNGDSLSLKVVRELLNADIPPSNCGFLQTPVNNIKTAVCINAFWNFHMNTESLRFVATETSVDSNVGTQAHIGRCTEF